MTQLDHYLLTLEIICMSLKCKPWDIRVCVSPNWHRKYWRYQKGRYECEICARLHYLAA